MFRLDIIEINKEVYVVELVMVVDKIVCQYFIHRYCLISTKLNLIIARVCCSFRKAIEFFGTLRI